MVTFLQPRPLIVFVHIPKTGGIALRHVLRSVYAERLLVEHPPFGWRQEWGAGLRALAASTRDYWRAFAGHAAYGVHELFDRPAIYLSSVRDPLQRFESYYNFVCHFQSHHHHGTATGMSIGEFYRFQRDQGDVEIRSFQCRMICGATDFTKAREFVHNRYLAVVPTSMLQEGMNLISGHLRWPAVTVPRLNVSEHKARINELTAADYRELRALNQHDVDLFKFCEDVMAARLDRHRAV